MPASRESDEFEFRPSLRLKCALVADRVMGDLAESGDHWLTDPLRNEYEWTANLGRQLGMSEYLTEEIHDTLMVLLPEINRMLSEWPPPQTPEDCMALAEAATKNLPPIEVYSTLLEGPSTWRRQKIPAECRIDSLPSKLRPILAKELAAELSRVFTRWLSWDIRQLRERRIAAQEAAKAEEAAAEAAARPPRRRPSPAELADIRRDRREGDYQPPGRM